LTTDNGVNTQKRAICISLNRAVKDIGYLLFWLKIIYSRRTKMIKVITANLQIKEMTGGLP
jgi:hypothetical protein